MPMDWSRFWPWANRSPVASTPNAPITQSALDEALTEAAAVLTPDELYALVTAATAEKQAEMTAEAAQAQREAVAVEERAKRQREPLAYIGIADANNAVEYVHLKQPLWQHERTVRIGTLTYEHVWEDADDVWVYRLMR